MRSNLDRLTDPGAPESPESSVSPSPAHVWLGSAQWLQNAAPPEGEPEPGPLPVGVEEARWTDDPGGTDPGEPLRRRWRSTPAAAIGLVAIGIIATLIALYTAFADSADTADVPISFPESAGAAPSVTTSAGEKDAAPSELVVSVVGLVHRPGLIHLSPQSRVADAIEKAGGARNGADLLSLNLAQPLRDGDQVLVGFADPVGGPQIRSSVVAVDGTGGAPRPTPGAPPSGTPPPGADAGPVNLNTATESELDTLPGVGPVTAAAIIAWRQANGSFTSVDQLAEVDGIGPARLEKLRDRVTV